MIEPPPFFDHARQKGADRAVHRFHVEVEGEVPIGLRAFEHGAVVHIARAIGEHVDRADAGGKLLDLGGIAHVELPALGALQVLHLRGIEIGRDDLAAFAHESLGDGPPDSLAGGGDEADFSLQTIAHGSVSYNELRMAASERRCRPPSKFSGVEPALERRLRARPFGIEHREPRRVAASALDDHVLAENSLEGKAETQGRAARGAFSASHFHS